MIVSTGTEILHGLYADTNARFIAEQLTQIGIEVVGIIAVPDDQEKLSRSLSFACSCADLVICTGGLGPTEDDLNRDVFASLWSAPLVRDAKAVEMMRQRFVSRGRGAMPAGNEVQADVPEGSIVLYNEWGTAPGFILPGKPGMPVLVAMPGPPKEMQPMFTQQVLPFLQSHSKGANFARTRTIHTYGQAESHVNDRCRHLFHGSSHVRLTILAKTYGVDLRIYATGTTQREVDDHIEKVELQIRSCLGSDEIYGVDDETLAGVVAQLLKQAGHTVCAAESCTGGLLAKLLTDIPGSSEYLNQCYVVYSNEAKAQVLGIDRELIDSHGAVSEEVARAMATGARSLSGANYGVGITGIAGPGGATVGKPVGLTYIAVAGSSGSVVEKVTFLGDREMNRFWAAQTALFLLRRTIQQSDPAKLASLPPPSSPTP